MPKLGKILKIFTKRINCDTSCNYTRRHADIAHDYPHGDLLH